MVRVAFHHEMKSKEIPLGLQWKINVALIGFVDI